jgi:hypothetical protein
MVIRISRMGAALLHWFIVHYGIERGGQSRRLAETSERLTESATPI